MREITHNEVKMVSGAGLTEVISSLSTAMENISATIQTTTESISSATDGRTIMGLSRQVMGLTHTYAKLSFISNLLTMFNTTTTDTASETVSA